MLLVSRAVTWLVVAFLFGLAIALLWTPVSALTAHIPLSYNEGWNGFHSLRLRTGGLLYPPVSPATFINYPPLSFYLVAALANFIGDDIVAGRIVALVALLVTTLNVGIAARRLGTPPALAIATALAFLCFVAIYFTDYVAVDDPQWLAHAFQSTGLVVLLGDRRDWRSLALVAALMVAGGLVKHNVLALPLAVTLWLAFEDRRALLRWLMVATAIAAAALALCVSLYGSGFIDQVIRAGRTSTTEVLILVLPMLGPHLVPFILAAAIGTWLSRCDTLARFTANYLVVSLVVGVALMTGSGVIYNTLFDLVIAMLLGSALFLQRIVAAPATDSGKALATALVALLLALRFIMLAPSATSAYDSVATDLARQSAWTAVIDRIRTEPGPVACETLALCYWAGRTSEIEFFNFGQKALLEAGSDAAFAGRIERGEMGLIQREITGGAKRLPPALEATIATHYRKVETIPTELWAPGE